MADVANEIDSDAAFQAVEEIAVVAAAKVNALKKRCNFHALDTRKHLDEPRHALGVGRSDTETAVAHHGGGNAVPRRRRHCGFEVGLRVVVRMNVNEPRSNNSATRVDFLWRRCGACANKGDLSVSYFYVGWEGRSAGSVNDASATDDEVR